MIRYRLACKAGHEFESWFQSASAYDRLAAAGLVACGVCGGAEVTKALMAPAVLAPAEPSRARPAPPTGPAATGAAEGPLSRPMSEVEAALAELRRRIEAESDYVGMSFAAEARAIHEGRAPERPIWGEAKREEARALIEDGVPVAPLPFLPRRATN